MNYLTCLNLKYTPKYRRNAWENTKKEGSRSYL